MVEIGSVHDWSNLASKKNKEVSRLYTRHGQNKFGYINELSFIKAHCTHTCYFAIGKNKQIMSVLA